MRMCILVLLISALAFVTACRKEEEGSGAASGRGASAPPASSADVALPAIARAEAPDDPELITENNRAVGLMGRYDYADAREIFERLVHAHPGWLDARVNLAIATLNRQQEGDEQQAIDILREVLKADPQHLHARFTLALLLDRAGAPEAKEHFEIVAEQDPRDPYAAYFYGTVLEREAQREEALRQYERAMTLDPYLASAYLGAQRVLQRLGRSEEAMTRLDEFQRLQTNPHATTIKTIYTMMGPKADAIAVNAEKPAPKPRPPGTLFTPESPVPLLADGDQYTWSGRAPDRRWSVTACDIDGNGTVDLFIPQALNHGSSVNAVILNNADGSFTLALDHLLATITDVNCALWGDYDNDGLTDVYLCRRGMNHLWKQGEDGSWQDVTAPTGTGNEEFETIDGAFFDADHDGDLDLFCINADGPNELLNNNLDGTFSPIASDQSIDGGGRAARQVLVVDLDHDRDLDIIVINEDPPHEVYLNDRLWQYTSAEGMDDFLAAPVDAIAAGDVNADGAIELYSLLVESASPVSTVLQRWTADERGMWTSETLAGTQRPAGSGGDAQNAFEMGRLLLADLTGDGQIDLLESASSVTPWSVWTFDDGRLEKEYGSADPPASVMFSPLITWMPVLLDLSAGPSIVALPLQGEPLLWKPGAGRYPFAALSFTGKDKEAEEMRSNASGIGTYVAARAGSRWTVTSTLRQGSGPGQSLQPLAIGLGGHDHLDYVEVVWPDGIFQSEVHGVRDNEQSPQRNLATGHVETIEETQRQISSCPVLFAWDGNKYAFVSDVLGVGGIGYMVAPGEYATPRPWENFLLPEGVLAAKGDQYVLKLGEPMEEACYLDAAKLIAWDLPPGWKMTVDERMGILGPEPTGEARFYRGEVVPVRALNDRGEDVTHLVLEADHRAAPVGERDPRFIGRLGQDHVLTMEFDNGLGGSAVSGGPGPSMLVIDGWVEYPYSQTMFAAWQAGADYRAPTLEACGDDGQWVVVMEQFGYPGGMPRQMSVPLELPSGTTALRLTTNQEIYWDRIAVARAEPCPEAVRVELPLDLAEVWRSGFPRRITGPQRLPLYDYADRRPLWDTRHQRGLYTAFGLCKPLVAEADGALAIIGPGEEVHLEFADVLGPPAAGWTRRFVLETAGWCKDMDLYTRDGETLEPMPGEATEAREELHGRFNTRYEGF